LIRINFGAVARAALMKMGSPARTERAEWRNFERKFDASLSNGEAVDVP
jgi:hypothetical protein